MNRLVRLRSVDASVLFKAVQQQQQTAHRSLTLSAPVLSGQAKDFKPGPYPKTEAERRAAAEKYNMRPEDYEPMPDDGLGFGDYPKLAKVSSDMKSDWEEWDDTYNKRNFGEPVLVYAEQVLNDKVTHKEPIVPWTKMLSMFLGAAVVFFGIGYATHDYKFTTPIAPKQFPRDAAEEKHTVF